MNYRKLGRTGLKVSEISLGSWLTYGNSVDDGTAAKTIAQAYELGINFLIQLMSICVEKQKRSSAKR